MKVMVNKCPHTGLLFESDADYRRHLQRERRKIRARELEEQRQRDHEVWLNQLYDLSSMDQIETWLSENYWRYAGHYGWGHDAEYRRLRPTSRDEVSIKFARMRWSTECRTTHAAPLGQRHTGWSDPHVPEAGWNGTIVISFKGRAYEFFCSRQLGSIGINTGTGGGSERGLSYEVTLFAKDFRRMAYEPVVDILLAQASD